MKVFNRAARRARHRSGKRRPIHLDFELCEDRVLLTNYLVNSAANTNTGVGNNGTLRYVLNQLPVSGTATNTINFGIGSGLQTIDLGSADLPAITQQVTIDGYTEPGASPNTSAVGTNAVIMIQLSQYFNFGLDFEPGSDGSIVRGLSIIGGVGSDIGISLQATNVTVAGDFIGIQADGTSAGPNRIGVLGGVPGPGDVIGTPALADRNLISGNTQAGVAIYNSFNNPVTVQGNLIGTDRTGLAAVANGVGVEVYNSFSSPGPITIGGTDFNSGNVISGNTTAGVSLAGASNVAIQGNLIGLAADGSSILGQGGDGILLGLGFMVSANSDNTIGGTSAGAGNIVSGNSGYGIDLVAGAVDSSNLIAGNIVGLDGSNKLAANIAGGMFVSGTGNTVGGTVSAARNVISGNQNAGLAVDTGTLVVGNYIGTNKDGTAGLSNAVGVDINGPNNTIGGVGPGAGNVISGNSGSGIVIESTGASNLVAGNLIGTDANGNYSINQGSGVLIDSTGNTIGGSVTGTANVISGNNTGVYVNASGNLISGNFIGTNESGTGSVASEIGVDIEGSQTTVGGTTSGSGNVISGNSIEGIYVNSDQNLIAGNDVGTNKDGTAAVPDATGVYVDSSGSNNTIGGTGAGAGNVISGNTSAGVSVNGASGVVIQGNTIGLAANGSSILGQGGDGITLDGGSSGNTIGGTIAGAGNIVSGNSRYGIDLIAGAGDTSNLLAGNIVGLDGSNKLAANIAGGMLISGTGNTVGGTVSAARNVISGNQNVGLVVDTGALVVGNYIGTGSTGAALKGASDQVTGISVTGTGNTVGGTVSAARNIISGNLSLNGGSNIEITGSANLIEGNYVGTNKDGTAGLFNGEFAVDLAGPNYGVEIDGTGNTIGGSVAGTANVISGDGYGVQVSGSGNLISGNFIGTDVTGTLPLGNSIGVVVGSGSNNTVGGTTAAARNIISGNSDMGVAITASMTLIEGNYVGTNKDGSAAVPNATGVYVYSSGSNNTIGGTGAGAGNVISGNTSIGIEIVNSTATGNVVQGNRIGTNEEGNKLVYPPDMTTGLPVGMLIQDSPANTIGGTVTGAGNVISGFGVGIYIAEVSSYDNLIQGNLIGTDGTGNVVSNAIGTGVYINGAAQNTVGGATAGAGNVILGYADYGVYIYGSPATGNVVQGNRIGLSVRTQQLAAATTQLAGIAIVDASSNTVGGSTPAAGNTISGNQQAGVYIFGHGKSASNNLIAQNRLQHDGYGVLLSNATKNGRLSELRKQNQFTQNGIANIRDYTGPVPSSGNSSHSASSSDPKRSHQAFRPKPRPTACCARASEMLGRSRGRTA